MKNICFENNGRVCGVLFEPKEKTEKIILLLHGFITNFTESGEHKRIAQELSKEGYAAFVLAYRGYKPSSGVLKYATISMRISDTRAAIKFLRAIGYKKIGIIAQSLAGAVVLLAKPKADVIILSNPCITFDIFFDRKYKVYIKTDDKKKLYWRDKDGKAYYLGEALIKEFLTLTPLKNAHKIKPPTLIIHGERDAYVPVSGSRKAYKLMKCKKKMITVKGADHGFEGFEDQVIQEMITWIKRSL